MGFQGPDNAKEPVGKNQGPNPYSSPVEVDSWQGGTYPVGNGSYVRQVRPLCVCMIIQGVLEVLTGVLWATLAVVVPMIIMSQQGAAPGGPGTISPGQQQAIQGILGAVYGISGGFVMLGGILRIIAGWRGLYFKSYMLCVVTLFIGLIDLVVFYCLPTAIGLCVWGCIVLFKPEVKEAFRLGAQGQSSGEIEAAAWNGFRG